MTLKQYLKTRILASLLTYLFIVSGMPSVFADSTTVQKTKPLDLNTLMTPRTFLNSSVKWYNMPVDFIGLAGSVSDATGQIYILDPETLSSAPGVFVVESPSITAEELKSIKPGQLIHVSGRVCMDTAACIYVQPDNLEILNPS